MKQKPFYYVFLSFFLLMIIVSFPLQIMYVLNFELKNFTQVFSLFTYQNWFIIIASAISMYYAWNVNPKLNYIVSFLALGLFLNSFNFLNFSSTDYSIFKTNIANFLFLVPFSFLFVPEYQETLRNKTKHWWKTPVRYRKEVLVDVTTEEAKISAKTINISKTGALLLINPAEVSSLQHLLAEPNKKSLKLKIYDKEFETEVDIIRFQKQKTSDNYQLAVNFKNISYKNKYKLYSQVLHHPN